MSKEIKPLSQAFLEAFNTKASRLKTEIAEKTEVKKIQEEIDSVNRKLSSARQGGFGDIKKLAEEKARLHKQLEEAMDPVNAKALKGKHSERKDKDIDNDGDVDSSDEYLHNRRKAISKAVKEDVEITELHMSLLEAHGIEKKVAERVKKVFDAMSTEDKAAFMKAYLKNPKAATEYMFKDMKKMSEEVELEEKMGDDDWVHINRAGSFYNPKKDTIVGYSKSPKDPNRAPKLKAGANSAMRIADAKKKGFVVKEEVALEEGYTINHKTFSSAVQHAKAQVEKQGYTIDDDEWDRKVAMGPKKPGTGKTNRYTIALMKNGKETKRNLQMQVYYDEGRYELNMYVS